MTQEKIDKLEEKFNNMVESDQFKNLVDKIKNELAKFFEMILDKLGL